MPYIINVESKNVSLWENEAQRTDNKIPLHIFQLFEILT